MTDYLGPIYTNLRVNDGSGHADDPRVTGFVDTGPLLDFIDEPHRAAGWQQEAELHERTTHRLLLRSIGADLYAVTVQRPQAAGTLAALYGAVL